ncbi:MAG: ABC transporter permease [Gammaproteobacteria bacterium]|nr:ABC transporter permease [Gammaproteobacteria bacterium]
MKYLPLLWANLSRKKTRTILTILSVIVAFLLFGMLDAVRVAFSVRDSLEGASRLVVGSRLSIIQPLPYADLQQIQRIGGVDAVVYANWFGGIYQDRKNFFANFAVSPNYLDIYPEFILPEEQKQAFLTTRTGAVAGENLANRFGWKLGDKIPLEATIFPHKNGGNTWTFDLVGIFKARESRDRNQEDQMLFRYDYFDEGRTFGNGTVGWYVVKIADPERAAEIAQAIDGLFANSADETKTQTEQQFALDFVKQMGDIGLIVTSIMGAVFFTILLLTGNTMSQAVRERIPELAVLKTLGFSNQRVLWLVLGESLLLVILGGTAGLLLSMLGVNALSAAFRGGVFQVDIHSWLTGAGLMVLLAVGVGLPPALRAMRLRIVDALAAH